MNKLEATMEKIDNFNAREAKNELLAALDEIGNSVKLKCAADITPEPIEWLWDGWLAKGKLHIFAGTAGTGKTTIALSLASAVSNGGRFPDGTKSPIGSVLIWSGEDSASDTLVPRLMAAGADLRKIHFVENITIDFEKISFDPAHHMPDLILAAGKIKDLSLLIIDPIVNAVSGDSHKNGEVRRALQPVVDFGKHLNCAVLGITHFSKGGQGKDPLERVTGSLAFGALARIVLATAKITEGDTTKRIVCRAKSNIGIDSGGFEYDLQQKVVTQGIYSSYVSWGNAIEGSAKQLLAEPDSRFSGDDGKSALEDAIDFLEQVLSNGEALQRDIESEAKNAGHSISTLRRAKNKLGIRSIKSKVDGKWYWRMNMINNTEDSQQNKHEHLEHLEQLSSNNNDIARY